MSRDTVVVTGASGFVGRRLVRRLADRGDRVVAAVRSPERAPSAAADVVCWDLEAGSLDPALLERTRAVAHLASLLPSDFHDPAYAAPCLRVNALGSLELFRQLAAAQVPALINFGSGNSYRRGDRPAREDDPLFPSERAPYYLSSKIVQEIYAEHHGGAEGYRLVTLRPSAVYGPGMKPSELVASFAGRLAAGQPVEVYDEGRYGEDLVYVDDVVAATGAAIEHEVAGPFNVGSGERTTVLQLARALAELLGAPDALVRVHPAREGASRGFAPLDVSRAKEQLGHRPTDLVTGLRQYLDWRAQQGVA